MLRLQVWDEALSAPAVFSMIGKYAVHNGANTYQLPPATGYVGPKLYFAGLSCHEARRVLKRTYGGPIRHLGFLEAIPGLYWINFDSAVIYLGSSSNTVAILGSFSADDLSKFKHVAIVWSHFRGLARTCQRLAASCPALRTVIIQRGECNSAANGPL